MRLAIVVGHNSEEQGAVRPDTGETEWRFNNRIARLMHQINDASQAPTGLELRTFHRRPGLGFAAEIREVYDEVDAWGADASIELHFNSFHTPHATGTEVLSSGTARSLSLAQAVQEELVRLLGLADRGIKTRASKERGGRSLHSGRAPAILVEPFFGSSPLGQRATDERHEERALAGAYLAGAVRAMRAWPRSDLSQSRTLAAASKIKTGKAVQATALVGTLSTQTVAELQAQVRATQEGLEEISAGLNVSGPLMDVLPYVSAVLLVGVLVMQGWEFVQAKKIEHARKDDHKHQNEVFGQ